MAENKRRLGDRKDGKLLRDLDSMHFIMPIIFPNRCDNEAYLSESSDLENINAYLSVKNSAGGDFKYTIFHVVVAALLKVIILRPKLNRFIANKNTYQRNYVSASFVVKKQFSDSGDEALAIIRAEDTDTIDSIHGKIYDQVTSCRSDAVDRSTESMDILNKLPRFISKFLVWIITRLDIHGRCPDFLIATDPYYSSVILSNLGSIKLKSGYHHLANWGTNSLFCIVGEKRTSHAHGADGELLIREVLDLGLTIDERLADGYYYSQSLRLLRKLLNNPKLLELPLDEEVDY